MRFAPRAVGLLFVALFLAGCVSMSPERFQGSEPRLVLEDYFDRPVTAWGIFEDRFGTLRREFRADITPQWDGRVLTLNEDFFYKDGERETRIWTFEKTAEGRYVGRAGDVIGSADVTAVGNAATFGYLVDLKMGGGTLRVRFTDWLYLIDERALFNRAKVTKFGFEIGTVTVFFYKDTE